MGKGWPGEGRKEDKEETNRGKVGDFEQVTVRVGKGLKSREVGGQVKGGKKGRRRRGKTSECLGR